MSFVYERYSPVFMGVNATTTKPSANQIGGFACQTSGAISVVDGNGNAVLTNFPVTVGVYTPFPFYTNMGFTATLSGGASGTLAVI